MKPPKTKHQVRVLLGVLVFYHLWLSSSRELAKPLIQLTAKDEADPVIWTKALDQTLEKIKCMLASAPALDLSNYKKNFILYIHESQGVGSGVLAQKFGSVL